jgi:hypothetical protein
MVKPEGSERLKTISLVSIPTTEAEEAQAKKIKNAWLPVTLRSPIYD